MFAIQFISDDPPICTVSQYTGCLLASIGTFSRNQCEPNPSSISQKGDQEGLVFPRVVTIVVTYVPTGHNYVIIAIMKIYCFNDFLFLCR